MPQRSVARRENSRVRPEGERAATKRVPLHEQKSKTGVQYVDPEDKKGYEDRWVNEHDQFGDRSLRFKTAGWVDVPREKVLYCGAEAVTHTESGGSFLHKQVGVDPMGKGLFARLMWIRKEWFDEDFIAKQAKIDVMEGQIRRTLAEGDGEFYGDVDISTRLHHGKRRI